MSRGRTLLVTGLCFTLGGCREDPGRVAASGSAASALAPAERAPSPSATPRETQEAPVASSAASTASESGPDACPPNMLLVEGEACSAVEQTCLRWLDDSKLPFARCARYDRNVRCLGRVEHVRFCIDRDELTLPGESLPASDLSFDRATKLCRARDKRMCLESEWTFACEGEQMRPYPYGFERTAVCNQDRTDLLENASGSSRLVDRRAPAGAHPRCVSPFGVRDMVGNVDELVASDHPAGPRFRNLLKGGWWMPARNRCRAATGGHDDAFHELQIGTRCCSDARDAPPPPAAR